MNFPDSIEGFGYEFSKDGKLQNIKSGKPFQFEVKTNDLPYNQKHYEALGELVTPYVYRLLEERCGLQKHPVPCDASKKRPKTFVFCSKNFLEAEKLLILIHGSGVVRAGQWARRLIINDCLDSGTQIPFIERGMKEGYGILIMNSNDNTANLKTIRESDTPQKHGQYVWKKYVRRCAANQIAIVAHSFGGIVTTNMMDKFNDEFRKRVFAVAMTDSVHFGFRNIKYLKKIGRNWVTSSLPLDTPIPKNTTDVASVSAGCDKHEMTSWSSFTSIFKFFEEKRLLRVSSKTFSPHCASFYRKKRGQNAKDDGKTDQEGDVPMEITEEDKNGANCSSSKNACKKLKEDKAN